METKIEITMNDLLELMQLVVEMNKAGCAGEGFLRASCDIASKEAQPFESLIYNLALHVRAVACEKDYPCAAEIIYRNESDYE